MVTNDELQDLATRGGREMLNAMDDMTEQAIDRLICEDIDLTRMKLVHSYDGRCWREIHVDDEPRYRITTTSERRGEQHFMVVRCEPVEPVSTCLDCGAPHPHFCSASATSDED